MMLAGVTNRKCPEWGKQRYMGCSQEADVFLMDGLSALGKNSLIFVAGVTLK